MNYNEDPPINDEERFFCDSILAQYLNFIFLKAEFEQKFKTIPERHVDDRQIVLLEIGYLDCEMADLRDTFHSQRFI